MTMGLVRWVIVAAVACSFACAPAKSPYVLDYAFPTAVSLPTTRYRLDNGLEVILQEDHKSPTVALNIWYHVGSKDDPPGRAGFAHLFEHLMFGGSRHVAEGEFTAKLRDVGCHDLNARTSFDRTNYFETVQADHLELGLWLESDRMAFLLDGLNQNAFERERNVVKNEFRQRNENALFGQVDALIYPVLFPGAHPYSHLPLGDEAQLNAAKLDEVRAFFRTFYVPNNATLVLVGDFESARTKELISKYFGAIPPGKAPPIQRDPTLSSLAREKRLFVEADVQRGLVVASWPVPPRYAPGHKELEVGRGVLQGWLWENLVKREKVADAVNVSLEAGQLASVLEVTVTALPNEPLERVLKELDVTLDYARAWRVDRVAFSIGRARLLMSNIYGAERFSSRADLLNSYNQYAGTPDYIGPELAARQSVLVEDVRDAFYQFLPFDKRVITFVTPRDGAPRSGRLVRAE